MGSDRVIWMYWNYPPGSTRRPPYLEACLETVKRNSGCRVIVCNQRSAFSLVPDLPPIFSKLSPSHQSDVFRLHVLTLHGGMYIDFDTIVLRSLLPLFDQLEQYELVGVDWRPTRFSPEHWQSLGASVMGPMRPKLAFMRDALKRQREVLHHKQSIVETSREYPFEHGELMQWLLSPSFEAMPPKALLKDGAATWFTFMGSPGLPFGNLGHAFRPMSEIGELPDSELFTLSNALMPDSYKWAPVSELLMADTVFGYLLRTGLGNSPMVESATRTETRSRGSFQTIARIARRITGALSVDSPHEVAMRPSSQVSKFRECSLSDVFDREWYLARYPEATGIDLLAHCLHHVPEWRDPNPFFDCSWYLAQNPDVEKVGIHPVLHYLETGAAEGRDPCPLFDTDWYLTQNPDVRRSGLNPLFHYLRFGATEGRLTKNDAGLNIRMLPLYRRYPALRDAERIEPRIDARRFVLELVPKRSVGAEIGVFTGRFASEIIRVTQPSLLYLVDPWWKAFGELFPDWGEYTAYGKLSTRAAYEATTARCQTANGTCQLVVEKSFDWLPSLEDQSLDWVYLDSTHEYEDTMAELMLLAKKVKRDGVILGDDWIPTRDHMHHGVFRAVHEFIASTDFRLILAGIADQWVLKRTE
jgi:Methyltransferase domain/Glycosyltransferase sugar-binding region containing DXD motif